ncbi:MAG: tetratricopeptide repeat protein [Muribaculaceae bacterium]|nr:tetratricopeptide repeat protein [Muribaculaceae bacterium]
MKFRNIAIILSGLLLLSSCSDSGIKSTRKERRLISAGNKLYADRKFKDAQSEYEKAILENPNTGAGRYNLGLSQIRQVSNPADTTAKSKGLTEASIKSFSEVSSLAGERPGLAEKAFYNLGNVEFNRQDYQKAIDYYKEALRIDPSDDIARKNLRIAQLQLKNQDQNQNKDQNKDQQQDQQDQNKDQQQDQQDQNKDQQQNQDEQNQDQQDQRKDKDISEQTASQILQAVDNKENATRAKVNRASKGDKSVAGGRNVRRW